MKRVLIINLMLALALLINTGCNLNIPSQTQGDFAATHRGHQLTEDDDKSPLPPPKGFVNDYAGVLDDKTKQEMEKRLAEFKERDKVDFVIAIVDTTNDKSTFDYSLALARGWGVGAKNPDKAGLLLLVAVKDRKWFIQLSRVIESVITDEETGQMGRLMNNPFREGKYGEGITRCVEAFIKTLSERRKTS